jgi:glutamate dehydrogenase
MATARRQDEAWSGLSPAQRRMGKALRERLARSLLPGEPALSPDELTEATAFLLEAARERSDDEPALLVRSALGERRCTRIAVINRDMPFLVDSIAATIAAKGLAIDLLLHPIVPARRDAAGRLTALADEADTDAPAESMIYLETRRVDAKERRELEKELALTLADVRAAVADWPRMSTVIAEDADRVSDHEGAALLRWLGGGMLTLLGHVTFRRDGGQADRLGICRRGARVLVAEETLTRAFAWFEDKRGEAPLIIKANRLSRVHRRVPLDLFIVPLVEAGKVAALSVHAGIWTSAALATKPEHVPLLRRHLAEISARFGFPPGGHDAKALVHALTVLPHDLVIGFSSEDLARVTTAMMALVDRPRPRVAFVTAPLRRHLFAFVWLPRDQMSTAIRLQIQQLLESSTGAETLDWSLQIEGSNLAMLRYVLDVRPLSATPDSAAVDAQLQVMLRGWTQAVEHALAAAGEPGRAAALAARYADAFPQGYRAVYGAAEAAYDIERMRRLAAGETDRPLGRDARLYRLAGDPPGQVRLKIYQIGGAMPLSDAVPALENFGFHALAEQPIEIGGAEPGTIHDFRLGLGQGDEVEPLLARAGAIELAIDAVINARAEDDVFNRLIVSTALTAREADWLRAFYRYLRQTGIAFTIYTVVDALRGAPAVTRALIDLFRTQHDPNFDGDRAGAAAKAEDAIRAGLGGVAAINHDRLLRLYWATAAAIVRTNAFAPAGADALAFKLDSSRVPGLPKPLPWREIFVYSRRVEGIHLRAGPVARGGLRWSDRRDDFRTEVLGLMKAQRTKNAVIVPTGAKGGFYPKRLPDPAIDREAWAAEGHESYKLFIRTLLSVTDNIVGNRVVHPAGVVVHDGGTPISWSPQTRARRLSRTRPTRSPRSSASGWATPSPAAARRATTTRRWALPRAARGSQSSATSSRWASTCKRTRCGWQAAATCRATCSATACCCRSRSACSPRSITVTSLSTPIPIPRRAGRNASGCSACPDRAGPTIRRA